MLEFTLPKELEAHEPPEARGLARDQVRLMVSYYSTDRIVHAQFRDLPGFLDPGDVLVTLRTRQSAAASSGTPA